MNLRRQQGILLILPALVVMGVFTFYPLLEGVRIAFTNKHLLKEGVEFVGLQNFVRLASDEIFWTSLFHSIVLTAVVVFLQFVFGLILAWAMSQELPGMSWFKSIIMASCGHSGRRNCDIIQVYGATGCRINQYRHQGTRFENLNRYWLGELRMLPYRLSCAAAFVEKCSFLRRRLFSGCHAKPFPEVITKPLKIDGANAWDILADNPAGHSEHGDCDGHHSRPVDFQ